MTKGGVATTPWRQDPAPGEMSGNHSPRTCPARPPKALCFSSAPTHSLPGYQHPCLSSSKKPTRVPKRFRTRPITRIPAGNHSLLRMKATYNNLFGCHFEHGSVGGFDSTARKVPGGTQNALSLQSLLKTHCHTRARGCQNIFFTRSEALRPPVVPEDRDRDCRAGDRSAGRRRGRRRCGQEPKSHFRVTNPGLQASDYNEGGQRSEGVFSLRMPGDDGAMSNGVGVLAASATDGARTALETSSRFVGREIAVVVGPGTESLT